MPPLHKGQPLTQPSSRQQQEAGHGDSSLAARQHSRDSSNADGLPHQLAEHRDATAGPQQRQDVHRQQHGGLKEQERPAEGEAPSSASPSPAVTPVAAGQPPRSRLSNGGGGGRSSRHAHFEDMAGMSSSHGGGGANAGSAGAGARPPGGGNADSSPVSNGSLAGDLPLQSPPGSPPAAEVVAAAAAAAASMPPGFQISQQRNSHPPLPGYPQHRRPGQRRAFSLAARSGSGASPRLGLEALLGVERSGYSGAGHKSCA